MTDEKTPQHIIEHRRRVAGMRREEERNPRPVAVPAPLETSAPFGAFGVPAGAPAVELRAVEGLRTELAARTQELAEMAAQVGPVIEGLRRRVDSLEHMLKLADEGFDKRGQKIETLERELAHARALIPAGHGG